MVRGFARLPFPLALLAAACSTPSTPTPTDPPCVTGLSTSCQPLYDPPIFSTIYDKIFVPNCATGTGTCHTADARQGGLAFANPDEAYSLLLDGRRVLPGDPSCSLIMKRLTSTDPSYHMPKGSTSLLPAEECTIVQWIAAGAKR